MQEFGQRRCTRLVHGRAHQHLDGLQIQTTRLAETVDDSAHQVVYFERGFLADRFCRFFSCGVKVSSTGRRRQTRSLTSTSS